MVSLVSLLVLLPQLGGHAGPALAYLTPEDVLLQQQTTYFEASDPSYLTPNTRRVEDLRKQQDEQRAALHPSTLFDPNLEGNASLITPMPDEAVTDGSESSSLPTGIVPADDPLMVHLIQRLERDSIGGNVNSVIGGQSQPLAPSGLETTVTLAVVLGAVGWTVWRAKKMKAWF
jgi:hypothetical protein